MNRLTGLAGVIAVAAVVLTGCAGYRLGTGAPPKFARLYIAPVTATALIPQAQALVTTQLREAFLKDGRVGLADSADAADAVLRLSLTGYQRDVTVASSADTSLARRFDISLTAKATLTITTEPKPAFTDRQLVAKSGVFTDSGQQQAEYQNLPLLAESLAQQAVHATLDAW